MNKNSETYSMEAIKTGNKIKENRGDIDVFMHGDDGSLLGSLIESPERDL